MKLVGQLYGVDLMLNTEDEALTKQVGAYFDQMMVDSKELAALKLEKEAKAFVPKPFWNIFK